jgi:hypothetical protein
MRIRIINAARLIFSLSLLMSLVISCQVPADVKAPPSAIPATQKLQDINLANISISPMVAEINKNVTVTVDVVNPNNAAATGIITLKVNGDKVDSKNAELGPKATDKISFSFSKDTVGSYKIQLGSMSGTVFFVEPGGKLIDLIGKANPELSKELLKLPDLKEIDDKDNAALGEIYILASNLGNRSFFEEVLNEGAKDRRPYCSPLEGILWLAYDDYYNKPNKNFNVFEIQNMLIAAWKTSSTSANFSSARWQNLDEVIARLSSPLLVSMYMKDNLKYDTAQANSIISKRVSNVFNLKDVFTNKKGVCHEMVVFAQHCLIKNGYKFEDISNGDYGVCYLGITTASGSYGHAVCLVRENKQYHIINNGTLVGPFSTIVSAVDRAAASVQMNDWSEYWLIDLDIKTDSRILETARYYTADSVKRK